MPMSGSRRSPVLPRCPKPAWGQPQRYVRRRPSMAECEAYVGRLDDQTCLRVMTALQRRLDPSTPSAS